MERRRGRYKNPNYVGGRGEDQNRKPNLWLVVLKLLAGGWKLREAQTLIESWLKHVFRIPGFENVSAGDGSDCQTG